MWKLLHAASATTPPPPPALLDLAGSSYLAVLWTSVSHQICSRSSAVRRNNAAFWRSLSQQCCKEEMMDGVAERGGGSAGARLSLACDKLSVRGGCLPDHSDPVTQAPSSMLCSICEGGEVFFSASLMISLGSGPICARSVSILADLRGQPSSRSLSVSTWMYPTQNREHSFWQAFTEGFVENTWFHAASVHGMHILERTCAVEMFTEATVEDVCAEVCGFLLLFCSVQDGRGPDGCCLHL